MRKILFFTTILLFQLNVNAQCDCIEKEILEELVVVDDVFVGRLIKKEAYQFQRRFDSKYGIKNDFTIFQVLKGNLIKGDTISIISGSGNNDCGFIFDIYKPYLIFARNNFTDSCRLTNSYDQSSENIKQILKYNSNDSIPLPPIPFFADDFNLTESEYANPYSSHLTITFKDCNSYDDETCINKNIKNIGQFLKEELDKKGGQLVIKFILKRNDIIENLEITSSSENYSEYDKEKLLNYIRNEIQFVTSGFKEVIKDSHFSLQVKY